MKNIITKLERIDHKGCDYKNKAYEILDTLNRNELVEIILMEKLNWVNIYSTNEYLKQEIYETLVQFRCEQNILGDVAAESYWN